MSDTPRLCAAWEQYTDWTKQSSRNNLLKGGMVWTYMHSLHSSLCLYSQKWDRLHITVKGF